jgi:hypothetical protein
VGFRVGQSMGLLKGRIIFYLLFVGDKVLNTPPRYTRSRSCGNSHLIIFPQLVIITRRKGGSAYECNQFDR